MSAKKSILPALRHGPLDLESIAERMGCGKGQVSNKLAQAKAEGTVQQLGSGVWELTDAGRGCLLALAHGGVG
jgi:hypothetical protein